MKLALGVVLAGAGIVPGTVLRAEPTPNGGGEFRPYEVEKPDNPPGKPARENTLARSPALRVQFGPYQSIQVNVDGNGQNIVGDAANEPSLAVNPLDPLNMVVGWRQFDTITSNFRQAGWGYTFDGGQHWTFPGVLEPGVFRSDPVLGADSHGTFYYQSLQQTFEADVYRSTNGGVSWLPYVFEYGGDKNWFTVDRTGGPSDGFLYGIWQRFATNDGTSNIFTRSIDGGTGYQSPVTVTNSPFFGTMAVGPNGELYVTGCDGTSSQDLTHFVAEKSLNASNPAVSPTFSGGRVTMGGNMRINVGPNPQGLLGQVNVAVDGSSGPTRGNAYILASVGAAAADPLDVRFIRSTNGGTSWSAPVRVNDDASTTNWQWMGAHSVAQNGRIDAIWNDTRGSGQTNVAQLFYAYSWDGGATWSPNVAVSPSFNTSLGYPQQSKMGDYDTIVSNSTGADVAYTATFNGEQDVYYLRVFPDCNGNGISDVTDVNGGASFDCDANHVPDECQASPACLGAGRVPDGSTGTPLTVQKTVGGDVVLNWGNSCRSDDPDYAIYEGTLGSFYSHTSRFCTTGGLTTKTFTPAGGNAYYLVTPTHADREGSYGTNSAGQERPTGQAECLPQLIHACGGAFAAPGSATW